MNDDESGVLETDRLESSEIDRRMCLDMSTSSSNEISCLRDFRQLRQPDSKSSPSDDAERSWYMSAIVHSVVHDVSSRRTPVCMDGAIADHLMVCGFRRNIRRRPPAPTRYASVLLQILLGPIELVPVPFGYVHFDFVLHTGLLSLGRDKKREERSIAPGQAEHGSGRLGPFSSIIEYVFAANGYDASMSGKAFGVSLFSEVMITEFSAISHRTSWVGSVNIRRRSSAGSAN